MRSHGMTVPRQNIVRLLEKQAGCISNMCKTFYKLGQHGDSVAYATMPVVGSMHSSCAWQRYLRSYARRSAALHWSLTSSSRLS
jgi:hypothetical protein